MTVINDQITTEPLPHYRCKQGRSLCLCTGRHVDTAAGRSADEGHSEYLPRGVEKNWHESRTYA